MLRVRGNMTGFRERAASMRALGPAGRAAALRSSIGHRVRAWMEIAPRDTNRYVRAWAESAVQIGAEGIVIPPLQKSRYLERYVEAFEFRIAQLAGRMRATEAQIRDGRPNRAGVRRPLSPSARARAEKTVQSLRTRIARERQRLRDLLAHDHALVIGAGPIYDRGGGDSFIALHKSWTKPTVRLKVYGGAGTLRHSGIMTVARLKNKEPHASIVQARIGMRAAKTAVMLARAKERYLAAVSKGRGTRTVEKYIIGASARAGRAAAVAAGLASFTR